MNEGEERPLWLSKNIEESPHKILNCILINDHKSLLMNFTVKKPGRNYVNQVMKFNITSK